MMRRSRGIRCCVYAVALLLALTSAGAVVGEDLPCCDIAFRVGGGVVGFPVSSADIRFETAIGLADLSLATWAEMTSFTSISTTLGGELTLTQDWLALGISARHSESGIELFAQTQAAPPAWLLLDGNLSLVGGATVFAEMGLMKAARTSKLVLSPFLAGILFTGEAKVTPSVRVDLSLDSDHQSLRAINAHLTSTVEVGNVILVNTAQFDGAFEAFSSLALSLQLPQSGVVLTGSLLPRGDGGFLFQLGMVYEWGDAALLSSLEGKPTSLCAGGVCY